MFVLNSPCHIRSHIHLLAIVGFLLALVPCLESVAQGGASPPGVRDIQLSFKRDPRVIDPYRGIGPWVTGSSFQGAAAQDTVEIRAEGMDATGKPAKISPQWTVSDSEMLTVSPSQGDDVKMTVHHPGESRLKITYQGLSKELVINAKYAGKFLLFQIVPPKPSAKEPTSADLKDQKEKLSYAAGMRLAKTLRAQSVDVNAELVRRGIEDVVSGGATLMSDDQVNTVLLGIETELNITEAVLVRRQLAERNLKAGEQFLSANKQKNGVVTLPSGLQYKIIKAGGGPKPTAVDVAFCQYRGTLIDGTEFDDSHKRSAEPVRLALRAVIKGWQEALQLMPAGSKWQLFVPPDLAYGERGKPRANIPPNATLVFEVDLLAVNTSPPASGSTLEGAALRPQVFSAAKTLQAQIETRTQNDQ
jgi:FKBP-type peptidyl-prolyl cis-trans isomerase FklB